MEKNKVYCVLKEDVDFESNVEILAVCKNIEDAKRIFNNEVCKFKDNNYEGNVVDEDDMSYLTYDDGCYDESHFSVSIEEHELI